MSANVQNVGSMPSKAGAPLKNLAVSFLIVLAGAAVVFFVLSRFGVATQIAGPIAGSFFYAITFVSQKLDGGRSVKGLTLLPPGVVDYSMFAIAYYLMFFYVMILLLATVEFFSFLGGLIAGMFGMDLQHVMPVLLVCDLITYTAGPFLLGKWVGTRSSARPYLVTAAAAVSAAVIGHLIDFELLTADSYSQIYGFTKTETAFWTGSAFSAVIFVGFGMLGCWRGRRRKMSAYFSYLLTRIPEGTRETMVSIAYDEAQRLARSS